MAVKDAPVWSVKECLEEMAHKRISVADLPPAYLRELLLDPEGLSGTVPPASLRLMICGGEALLPETVKMAGDHYSVLKPPGLDFLAAQLRRRLTELD